MTDVESLKDLVLWARDHNIRIHQATVGTVMVVFDDFELQAKSADPKAKPIDMAMPSQEDIAKRYAPGLVDLMDKRLAKETGAPTDQNSTYLDDDEP